ncbi:MAG TPA: SIMPL domain-containing protein [Noviherbaspirillum sp.]|uniref:SIMPL domain-containing protein n=1 Tax=Noviherbaspirillum sp. TaxID=1926288 RepID=UPI002B48716C|nr:SIMPL domain-containing protein [Noviherbaspirillum sp.]HJV85681.1 SIMPL domain-containing protein [Noviherbaspirillum sp.]
MSRLAISLVALILFAGLASARAQTQSPVQTTGTLVVVSASGDVKHPNDEAHATLMIEEQDKDKAAAASRVNQKMKQGMEIVRREDPTASLKTRSYYTYPVYGNDHDQARQANRQRQPVGWRVGQFLDVTTQNLNGLPKTIASAQRVLALNALYFGLTETTAKKLEEQRIAAAYQNLAERIAAIAKALGKSPSDAVLETLDFEGPAIFVPQHDVRAAKAMGASQYEVQVEEPSFEPGETSLSMRVVGKFRFK